jgi:Tfp pilus assembly protein PilX
MVERIRNRLAREEGFALVLALSALAVLTIGGTSAYYYASANLKASTRSRAQTSAYHLAELALNNAHSVLFNASNPRDAASVPTATITVEQGTATWSGSLSGSTWTLTGTGRIPGSSGDRESVVTLSGQVALGTGTASSSNNAIWNYLYADSTTSCTNVRNSAVIDIAFYVRGDLCMFNSASITSQKLQVGGTVTLNGTTTTIGTAGTPIAEAHVGHGCRINNGSFHTPCSPVDRVWANTVTSSPTGLFKPPVDLAGWYANSAPGPQHACTQGSFPGGFDNDSVMNRSRGTIDLMPTTAYDCRIYSGTTLIGQISWTPGAPGNLQIAGTLFFDGDLLMDNNDFGVYTGRATIYASGTIKFRNFAKLCGVATCDGTWNANQNLLAFVAGSSTDEVGFSAQNNTMLQGAV